MKRNILSAVFISLLLAMSATPVMADGQYGDDVDEPKKEEPKEEVVHQPEEVEEIVDAGLGDINFWVLSGGLIGLGVAAHLISKKTQTLYWLD